jgi:hypothetical protein
MIRHALALALMAAAMPATSQDWRSAYSIESGGGSLPVLTVVVDPACEPCLRAYTEIVSRMAISDPVLTNRSIRWIPAASDEVGVMVTARALERRSIDALAAPVTTTPRPVYIEQARSNATLLRVAGRSPLFILPNRPTKAGYTNWTDFATWLSP